MELDSLSDIFRLPFSETETEERDIWTYISNIFS
jgi:hypothetical protein